MPGPRAPGPGPGPGAAGEQCVDGNYEPAWTNAKCKYQVLGAWPEKLWKQYKLEEPQWLEYLHLSKDGLPSRKRNYEVWKAWKEAQEVAKEVEERTKRIRSNPALYQPFKPVPEVAPWLKAFESDALRYPFLLVHAPSFSGKTEWAESLFRCPLTLKVGTLTQFPDGLRTLDR